MTMRRTMTWSFCDLHLLVQILRRRVARSSILYNLLGSSSLRPPLGRSFVARRILNENGYSTVQYYATHRDEMPPPCRRL